MEAIYPGLDLYPGGGCRLIPARGELRDDSFDVFAADAIERTSARSRDVLDIQEAARCSARVRTIVAPEEKEPSDY